jgi:hypothetical protein
VLEKKKRRRVYERRSRERSWLRGGSVGVCGDSRGRCRVRMGMSKGMRTGFCQVLEVSKLSLLHWRF